MAKFRVFWKIDFSLWTLKRIEEIRVELRQLPESSLSSRTEAQIVDELSPKYQLEPLAFQFSELYATSHEELIPANHFPPLFHVVHGKSYPKPVYRYHLPFLGNPQLLEMIPNPRILMTHDVEASRNSLTFDIVDFNNDSARIKAGADNVLDTLKRQSSSLAENVAQFNAQVSTTLLATVKQRKEQLAKTRSVMSGLGVPFRDEASRPNTQAVDVIKKVRIPLPAATPSSSPGQLTPTLDLDTYRQILSTIDKIGKNMERYPSQYLGKDEESLRDSFIIGLESAYEFQANGEAFNRNGKTDILVRYEQNTLFVAECKFWSGAKMLSETIDQVLSYLTWRDSKATILFFVPGKQIQSPLDSIWENVPKHGNFIQNKGKHGSSWFDYVFHLPGDRGTHINVAVQVFHFPR